MIVDDVPGGVVDGIGSVIKNVQSGNILGAILSASNTYNNAKKIKEVQELLPQYNVKGLTDIGCTVDIPETADTFEGNAFLKASYVFENFGFTFAVRIHSSHMDRYQEIGAGT